MEIKVEKSKEEEYPPETLEDPKKVCYWYEQKRELLGNKKTKAKKFLESGCVLETEDQNKFVVKHIKGYNITNHQVDLGSHSCSCQANQKNGIECSHITAVKVYKFQKNWNNRQENPENHSLLSQEY